METQKVKAYLINQDRLFLVSDTEASLFLFLYPFRLKGIQLFYENFNVQPFTRIGWVKES